MTISEIRMMPTCIVGDTGSGAHESVLRSYQILEKVCEYLRRGVPADVVLELVREMNAPTNRVLRFREGSCFVEEDRR